MIKIVCLLKRKAGTTRAQFREYYEANHAPLIESKMPYYDEYYRNYIADTQDYETGHLDNKLVKELDFDVITELTFSSQENYEKLIAALSDPVIGAQVTADEENFMDRSKMSVYVVEEARSTRQGG
jgi:uncharacterized protein (TIGR02118 family)